MYFCLVFRSNSTSLMKWIITVKIFTYNLLSLIPFNILKYYRYVLFTSSFAPTRISYWCPWRKLLALKAILFSVFCWVCIKIPYSKLQRYSKLIPGILRTVKLSRNFVKSRNSVSPEGKLWQTQCSLLLWSLFSFNFKSKSIMFQTVAGFFPLKLILEIVQAKLDLLI